MKYFSKYLYLLLIVFLTFVANTYADQLLPPEEAKILVKKAVIYALETRDPNMDYSKYVSKSFINPIDGKIFNYDQWVTHQKHIKNMVKMMRPTFDLMVAEGNQVAAIYRIVLTKNDGTLLEVKDLAFFKIKNKKIIYCEELTHLIKGNKENNNIGSTQ